jgi:hypothetical protein
MLSSSMQIATEPKKKKGFTSPSGRFYEWTKPTPPTQEDIDAIVAFDKQQAKQQPRASAFTMSPGKAEKVALQKKGPQGRPNLYATRVDQNTFPTDPAELRRTGAYEFGSITSLPGSSVAERQQAARKFIAETGIKDAKGFRDMANRDTAALAKAISPYVPHKLVADIVAGVVTFPINAMAEVQTLLDPNEKPEVKARAAANIAWETAGGAVIGAVAKPVIKQVGRTVKATVAGVKGGVQGAKAGKPAFTEALESARASFTPKQTPHAPPPGSSAIPNTKKAPKGAFSVPDALKKSWRDEPDDTRRYIYRDGPNAGLEMDPKDIPTKGQVHDRWMENHSYAFEREGDKYVVYHGTPKKNSKGIESTGLPPGSNLAFSADDALHYASRDRDLAPNQVKIYRLVLDSDQMAPSTTWPILREKVIPATKPKPPVAKAKEVVEDVPVKATEKVVQDQFEPKPPSTLTRRPEPRSKAYYIHHETPDGSTWKQVKGERVTVPGFESMDTFAHISKDGGITLSDGMTGRLLGKGSTKEAAVQQFLERVNKSGTTPEKYISVVERTANESVMREGLGYTPRWAADDLVTEQDKMLRHVQDYKLFRNILTGKATAAEKKAAEKAGLYADGKLTDRAVQVANAEEARLQAIRDIPVKPETPPAKPPTGAPVATKPKPPVTASVKNADTSATRAEMGLDELPPAERKSWETSLKNAQKNKFNDPDTAKANANRVLANGGDLTNEESAGIAMRMADLKGKHKAALSAGDENALKAIEDEFDILSTATKQAGTETARNLAARKLTINQDFDLISVKQRAKVAAGGKLNPKAEKQLEDLTTKLEAAETRVKELERGEGIRAARRVQKRKSVEQLDTELQDILKDLVQSTAKTGAGIDPAAFKALGRLAFHGVERGYSKVEDIVEFVLQHAPNASRKDIEDALDQELNRQRAEGTPYGARLDAAEVRTEKRRANYQAQLDSGNLTGPEKKAQTVLTKQLDQAKFEADQLRKEISRRIHAQKPKTAGEKIGGAIGETVNLQRQIMTSGDFSAVGRQGGILGWTHLFHVPRALEQMVRATISEKGFHVAERAILERPHARMYEKAGLYLAKRDHTPGKAEEAFLSRIASKLPIISHSERAYVAYLNRLRADVFDSMSKSWIYGKQGPSQEELKAIANYINLATGRGHLKAGKFDLERAGDAMSTVLFSPRFVTSRAEMLALQPMWKGTAKSRAQIGYNYAKYAAGVFSTIKLAEMAGAEVNYDPTSSDFLKIKMGETRIDALSGLQQPIVLAARLWTSRYTTTGGSVKDLQNPEYGQDTRADVAVRFGRTKLAPIPATTYTYFDGKNVIGEPFDWEKNGKELVTPMIARDLAKNMEAQGIPKGIVLGILASMGIGVNTHDKD